jgi:hypothetical protein
MGGWNPLFLYKVLKMDSKFKGTKMQAVVKTCQALCWERPQRYSAGSGKGCKTLSCQVLGKKTKNE